MNSKTTLFLATVCVVLGAAFFWARSNEASRPAQMFTPQTGPIDKTTHNLLDDENKLGDVVRVEIARAGHETVVFEKQPTTSTASPGPSSWRMTAPIQIPIRSLEAEGFGRNINGLQYQVSYDPGDPGEVSAADAGLDPPKGTVAVTDADGKSVTVEVGKRLSSDERYVRLAGEPRICIAKSDLLKSLKSNLVEYRDQTLWNFAPGDATRVNVMDHLAEGGAVEYVFVKDGARWMMSAPVSARATDKIDELVTTMSHMRAVKWELDATDTLAAYGLDPAATTVKVTVEKQVPAEVEEKTSDDPEADDDKPVEMKTETSTYVLRISDRSPIGEDTKTYMRVGDETMVASVMKATVDKFKPAMAAWRDMSVTAVDVATASRIAIEVDGQQTAFTKGGDGWKFETDDGSVEPSQITELLGGIKTLSAVAFVDHTGGDLAAYGLAAPRATVSLTVPGAPQLERIAVGAFTDQKTRRLVYVRRNDATSIAKVRTADVDVLLKTPLHYRDRNILSFDPAAVSTIQLKRVETAGQDPSTVTLSRTDGQWTMSAPVDAAVDGTKIGELVSMLAAMKARTVVADGNEATSFGLHAPTVTVAVTIGSTPNGEGEAFVLAATQHEGKYYAKRDDRSTIYEITSGDYGRLIGELRSLKLCPATEEHVTSFAITQDGNEQGFLRRGEKWVFQSEPDLPLDQEKVKALLANVLGLQAIRYARNKSDAENNFGLGAPAKKVSLSLDDGTTWTLTISTDSTALPEGRAFFARTSAQPGVALMDQRALDAIAVDLDALEAR